MIFKEWKEFVVYPLDSSRVTSVEQRLNTHNAFRVGVDGQYPPKMFQTPPSERAAVIPLSLIVSEGDEFDCMEIDNRGLVHIWTREKVWFLTCEGKDSRIEKLRYVLRHPPKSSES